MTHKRSLFLKGYSGPGVLITAGIELALQGLSTGLARQPEK